MALHFSKEEFSKRKQDVLKSMKEQNLDALLMFRQESMYWLTGYDTFGYVFFQTLVLDQKGNIILLTRAPDLRQAQNTSNIQDIRIWVDKDGINPTDDLKIILDELSLKGKNIGCEIYYPLPLHFQDCFHSLNYKKGDFPESERAADETLALPISHEITQPQQEYIVESIRDFFTATYK